MEKEINGKKYTISELGYLQGIEIEETKQSEGLSASVRKMIRFSTGLSDEEINKLSMKDGLAIQKVINEVNEMDFQSPTKED